MNRKKESEIWFIDRNQSWPEIQTKFEMGRKRHFNKFERPHMLLLLPSPLAETLLFLFSAKDLNFFFLVRRKSVGNYSAVSPRHEQKDGAVGGSGVNNPVQGLWTNDFSKQEEASSASLVIHDAKRMRIGKNNYWEIPGNQQLALVKNI